MTEQRDNEPIAVPDEFPEPVLSPTEPEAGAEMGAWRPVLPEPQEEPEPEPTAAEPEASEPEPVAAEPVVTEPAAEAFEAEAAPEAATTATVVSEPTPEAPQAEASAEVGAQEPVVTEAELPASESVAPEGDAVASEPGAPVAEVTEPAPTQWSFPVAEADVVSTEAAETTQPTQQLTPDFRETAAVAAPAATIRIEEESVSHPAEPTESIFRPASPSQPISPAQEATTVEQLSAEEAKLAAERAARRDARVAALAATAPQPLAAPAPVVVHKRTNDKFWGSLGLFLLRLVVAAIFTVRGLNILTDIPAAAANFAKTILPEPTLLAIITGVASLLIALALVLGLLTRVAGLGIALIAGGALAFVLWGPWSPFIAGQSGFIGELELLLAAVGLLFLFVGGGGWSLDRSFRSGRERDKAEKAALGG